MKRASIPILLVLCAHASFGQPSPEILWTRTYGGSGDEGAFSIQQTTDGGYIVGGYTDTGASHYVYLVKTNGQGNTLWTRTYRGSGAADAHSVQQTADGGYVVAGCTSSFSDATHFYLIKTNSQGDTLWTRTYGGSDGDYARSVQQTADGGYIVAGTTHSFGAGHGDFYLVKTNTQGDTLWTRTYGGSYEDWAYCVQQTTDGGYILAGSTNSFGGGGWNFYLVKTNSQGEPLWTRTYGESGDDWAYSVQQTADGGYVLAGYTYTGIGDYDFYLVKTNSDGGRLWTSTYGPIYDETAYSVQQTTDGGYIVAGWIRPFAAGTENFYLAKTNNSGELLWTGSYGGSAFDWATSVQQTADGGYIVAGETSSFGAGGFDFYVVKTAPESPFHLPAPFTLVSPAWGDTCWGLDTTLAWQAAIDPDTNDTVTYEVWMDTLADLSTTWEAASGLADTVCSLEDLADDRAYYWTVHASDLNTIGRWAGDTLMLQTFYPEPPEDFALTEPEDGDTVFTTTPILRWRNARDPDPGDFIRYRLIWAYDATYASSEDTIISDSLFTFPPELLLGSNLDGVADDSLVYWKVHSIDRFGLTSWCVPSNGWSFRVFVEEAPLGFDLISPCHGDTLDSLSVEFVWTPSSDPDLGDSVAFYQIQLALDSLFSTEPLTEDVMTTHLLWDSLRDDQIYWWRAKAFDSYGASTFSNQIRQFQTYFCEVPLPNALLAPTDSSQIPYGEINFCWHAARDPDPGDIITYALQFFVQGELLGSIPVGTDTCLTADVGAFGLPDGAVVEWLVKAHSVCPDTTIESASRFHFYPTSAVSGGDVALPTEFALYQNYPNPFNPVTMIRYDVKEMGLVSVKVFDLLGREVMTLVHSTVPTGTYSIEWDGGDLPSGLYLCRMEAAGFVQTRKMMLLK